MFDNLQLLPAKRVNLCNLVDWSGRSQRGLPAQPAWRLLRIGDETLIAAGGSGKTCCVFAPVKGQLELFSYDLKERIWSLYNRPPQYLNQDLKDFLAEVVAASESVATA